MPQPWVTVVSDGKIHETGGIKNYDLYIIQGIQGTLKNSTFVVWNKIGINEE